MRPCRRHQLELYEDRGNLAPMEAAELYARRNWFFVGLITFSVAYLAFSVWRIR